MVGGEAESVFCIIREFLVNTITCEDLINYIKLNEEESIPIEKLPKLYKILTSFQNRTLNNKRFQLITDTCSVPPYQPVQSDIYLKHLESEEIYLKKIKKSKQFKNDMDSIFSRFDDSEPIENKLKKIRECFV
jgi:hypothetical protein